MNDAHTLRTPRLSLSAPRDADIDAIFAIHSDARTYEHRPELAMKTRDEAVELARVWQANWREKQLGYYVVSTLDDTTIGFTGVRHSEEAGEEVLNLYYRFAPESQGQWGAMPRRPQPLRLPMRASASLSSPSSPSSTPSTRRRLP